MEISTFQLEFAITIDSLSSKKSRLYRQIESLGFKSDKIKSTNYDISENRIYARNRPSYDSGFVGNQTLLLEFKNTESEISRLIKSFSNGNVDAKISFKFKLSDDQKVTLKAQVIEKAIDDANNKAQVIAKKNGLKVGRIIRIKYGNLPSQFGFMNDSFEEMIEIPATHQERSVSMGFSVQEIAYVDEILIYYELK